jgi:hypothetical protein
MSSSIFVLPHRIEAESGTRQHFHVFFIAKRALILTFPAALISQSK